MMRIFSALLIGAFLLVMGCSYLQSTTEVPRIGKDELKAKLGSPTVALVDVRSQGDWDKSGEKIAGAVRMDPQGVDAWAGTLPKDKEIVLYCA